MSRCYFQSAPFEVIDNILTSTNPETVSSISQTSRAFHAYIRDNVSLWLFFFAKYFDLTEEDRFINRRLRVQSRIRAKHTILASFPAHVSSQELEDAFKILVQIARSVPAGRGFSKNIAWLEGILTNPALWPPRSPLTSVYPQLDRYSQSQSELQVLECDQIIGRPEDRFKARTFVYDMRNYCQTNLYGPFTPQNSQNEPLKINYVHLGYLMNVLSNNLRDGHGDYAQGWAKRGFENSRPMTASPSTVDGDWAGVQGDWLRFVSWVGYGELEEYNWPDGSLPEITDELDSSIFRNPWFTEGHAFLEITLRVTSIAPPSRRYPERKPTICFEGNALGGDSSEVRVQGTVHDEGGGVVRWSMTTDIMEGSPIRWHTEGVQIGGVQSAVGWVGCWTSPRHEAYDPAGPSWMYKL